MRKPAFCMCERLNADQLRYRTGLSALLLFSAKTVYLDQLKQTSVVAQAALCLIWLEILEDLFLATRFI